MMIRLATRRISKPRSQNRNAFLLAVLLFFTCGQSYAAPSSESDEVYSPIFNSPEWKDFAGKVEKNFQAPLQERALVPACIRALKDMTEAPLNKLLEACISSVLESLSNNSRYVGADEVKKMEEQGKTRFVGIGLELRIESKESGFIQIVSAIEGGPAEKADLRAGDIIISVDGVRLRHRSLEDAVQVMRGSAGTSMDLLIARRGVDVPLKFAVIRQPIAVRSVSYKLLEGSNAYLRVSQFNERTRDEFLARISRLEIESGGPLQNVIIDLRNNVGGTLPSMLGVAALLLPDGVDIVRSAGQRPSVNRVYRVVPADFVPKNGSLVERPILTNLRIVRLTVLVDSRTAGGCEALVAALQAHRRARVIGDVTFGTAEITEFFALENGTGMWLKTGSMFSPTGQSWEGKGIAPDVFAQSFDPTSIKFGELPNDLPLSKALESLQAR
jgi:carboxyl-terminal processing protease